MKTLDKRDYSLYGIVYPCDMSCLRKKLNKISQAIKEIYSQKDPERLIRIEFDFKLITKGDVYKFLIEIIKLPNGMRCSERKLAKILALFTNLTDNPVFSKRLNAILRSYKRYKRILNAKSGRS